MRLRSVSALGAALVLPLAAAFGQADPPPSPAMPGMQTPAGRAMLAGMDRMNKAMGDAAMTGDPDTDFARMMLPHHQGAIDMAEVELKYGRNPELRTLASRIVQDQKKEIGQMQRWLAAHP